MGCKQSKAIVADDTPRRKRTKAARDKAAREKLLADNLKHVEINISRGLTPEGHGGKVIYHVENSFWYSFWNGQCGLL